MNTSEQNQNSELSNRIALTSEQQEDKAKVASGNTVILAPVLTATERRIVDRLLLFAQQQANQAADSVDLLANFHAGISFGYWASARAICEERKLFIEDTNRICGDQPPATDQKGN